ncbi:MAG TPA: YkvA family protein [Candidatus Limnocylindrales bacterium]|nr:YkvA family protein [Candidatus Limnocylindrales bacterium]
MLESLKAHARHLRAQTLAIYYAARDPRTPAPARLLAALVVAYALSPIDLIPDFIPILGYLDDLLLVPLGLALCLRMIPEPVMVDARAKAASAGPGPSSYAGAVLVVALWLLALWLVLGFFRESAE